MGTVNEGEGVYGMHLRLRLIGIANTTSLESDEGIQALVQGMVDTLNMRVIAGPLVATEVREPMWSGKTAAVILAESHAVIHAYPHVKQAFVDVFACRLFDSQSVLKFLKSRLGAFRVAELDVTQRGLDWPGLS